MNIASIQVILAFGLWSTLGVFFNKVSLPTSTYVVLGSVVGLCVLYIYYWFTKGGLPKIIFSWSLFGIFIIAGLKGIVWFKALTLLPVAHAMLIHNLGPAVAILLAPLLIKEKPRVNHVVAVITGFLGLVVLLKIDTGASSLFNLGIIFSLLAAFSSGLQDVLQRKISSSIPGSIQAFVFILGQALGSVVFMAGQLPHSLSWLNFGEIVFFGVVGTALPIILLSLAFKHLKSFEVATLGYTEPVLGALWATLFLNQPLSPGTVIGGILIFFSGLTAIKTEK